MINKIIGVSILLILLIFEYLYIFKYIKAKNIIRIIMALILLAGIVFLIKMQKIMDYYEKKEQKIY